ncbi:CPBP family intramembrane glutamic endopeptidase [Dolichospermum circinale]|uniref:CPBP family intramembrane glutamic endopeptidase n=1 Tax=Dolichospermum circinale TaxID=109265 RepID=UPI0004229CC2|nr:CPBP family intramembrane glutamic endopeptidase [Dolichospermum circinale]MDB9483878.1 CPBP family intramembrane metalloprotease [Dolichospermum circinale CS-537/05]MDB9453081.1 CPBP family intramembrane metalloprotease [Dolichospermum circinale CS-541/06]MDB9464737.1 CPBP family intramembrane metalloprotease [Dolichospermum circinale CS-541/04]MDB9476232.1 CPBP family intramembrane metalloprotease [Dolichospermum circinale CS-537/11]MDB9479638.1 CPBP family intramembrane metalloprotease [
MIEQQNQEPEIPYLTRTQVLVAMGVTAIVLWIVAKLWLHWSNVILFKWYWHEQDLLLGIGLGLIITILSSLAYRFLPNYRKSADYYLEMVLKPLAMPDLIWLGLLPGLSEELLFRGVMLPALGADHLAVIVSSLCFGVLHLSGPQQWPYVIWATLIGVILGYSALLSGNLLLPIVAHIVTNLFSSYLWKIKNP